MNWQAIQDWFVQNPTLTKLFALIGVLILSYILHIIIKKYLVGGIHKLALKTRTKFDDIVMAEAVLKYLPGIIPLLVLYYYSYLFPTIQQTVQRVITAVIIFLIMLTISAFLSALNNYYDHLKVARGRPIKGYIEVIKIILYVFVVIIIIGVLTGQSPWVLLSGVGALTAVLILVFRDTILSFVASIQISSYDLVRRGDWIEVPSFGADGDVIDIALHTVQIQNWDKTISIIPTHKLLESTFKNWRGMMRTGGRRIKRSICIDQNSVKFVDEEMLNRFLKIQLLKEHIERKKAEIEKHNIETKADVLASIVNGRRMTNLGSFRAYINAYLKQHPKIHQNLTIMVRQMQPGPNGIPLEIYAFTNDVNWINYEGIQSDIFDHILAIIHEFELRIFQLPIGKDLQALSALKQN